MGNLRLLPSSSPLPLCAWETYAPILSPISQQSAHHIPWRWGSHLITPGEVNKYFQLPPPHKLSNGCLWTCDSCLGGMSLRGMSGQDKGAEILPCATVIRIYPFHSQNNPTHLLLAQILSQTAHLPCGQLVGICHLTCFGTVWVNCWHAHRDSGHLHQ